MIFTKKIKLKKEPPPSSFDLVVSGSWRGLCLLLRVSRLDPWSSGYDWQIRHSRLLRHDRVDDGPSLIVRGHDRGAVHRFRNGKGRVHLRFFGRLHRVRVHLRVGIVTVSGVGGGVHDKGRDNFGAGCAAHLRFRRRCQGVRRQVYRSIGRRDNEASCLGRHRIRGHDVDIAAACREGVIRDSHVFQVGGRIDDCEG